MSSYLEDNKNSIALKAWNEFADQLKQAGQTIVGEFGATDARERVDGFRYLSRLLSIGLDLHLEHNDPEYPTFTRMISDTRKYIGDNPDAEYDYASLRSDLDYLITAKRGVSDYLAFCLYGKNELGKPTVGSNLSDKLIQIEADGSFELYIAKENRLQHKNFLQMDEHTNAIVVRQYFTGDRSGRGSYAIKTLSKVAPKKIFNEQDLAEHLAGVAEFVNEISTSSSVLSILAGLNSVTLEKSGAQHEAIEIKDGKMDARGRPSAMELVNKIDPASIAMHMPTPDIQYSGAWWELNAGEAVVIEGKKIPCRYWSIQIFNRWLESPDYRYDKVSINNTEIEYENDASFKVVLAAENKGFKNWISTNGYSCGQVVFRALLAEEAPEVTYRVTTIAALLECDAK